MIITTQSLVTITNSQLAYYISKGYSTSIGSTLLVDVEDLPTHTIKQILVSCDECKEIFVCTRSDYTTRTKTRGRFLCRQCSILSGARHLFEDIYEAFKERNMYLCPQRIRNTQQSLWYYCHLHDKTPQVITYNCFSSGGSGCAFCARETHSERMKGRLNPAWKGEGRQVKSYLRGRIRWWFNEWAQTTGYKCRITGAPMAHVHHTVSFANVVRECIHELQLPYRATFYEYEEKDRVAIELLCNNKHKNIVGVPIAKEVHKLFHKLYSIKSFNYDNFLEFEQLYKQGHI